MVEDEPMLTSSRVPVGLTLLTTITSVVAAGQTRGRLLSPSEARSIPVTEAYTTSADGVRIYYRAAGSGDAVVIAPFALYHGTALDRLAAGRRVVTYDPRGRGRSAAVSPDKVSRVLLLTDLEAVRRAIGAERVALIGWSGGGMETFVYAMNNPGRVSRLVQLAPVPPRFSPYGEQMMADRQQRTDQAAARALDARVKAGEFTKEPAAYCRAKNAVEIPALLADKSHARLIPDVCTSANEYPDTLRAYFDRLFTSIDGFNLVPSLAQVTIPRLVVHALQDNIPLDGNEEWVRGQSNARLLLVEGSGHFPLYEQPEKTLQAIATFLDGGWPPGGSRHSGAVTPNSQFPTPQA
jgi:pimeloyl-ACP methyl ester carboxylesterase